MARRCVARDSSAQVVRDGVLWLFAVHHYPAQGEVNLIARKWYGTRWITVHNIFLPTA